MRILFIGDVSGRPGREMLKRSLADLQWDHKIDFTIVNGENSSNGRGLSKSAMQDYTDLGIDAITMGNHVWDRDEGLAIIEHNRRVVRPANLCPGLPGRGWQMFECCGQKIAVINLLGRVFMNIMPVPDCPFRKADELLKEIRPQVDIIIVDFHAEATSEKTALAHYLDGRVTAVLGTHTHVQTNDARLLPRGTAYVTDAGMTGVRESCLGMAVEPIITRFATGRYSRFVLAEGDLMLNGVVLDVAGNGRATDINLLNIDLNLL